MRSITLPPRAGSARAGISLRRLETSKPWTGEQRRDFVLFVMPGLVPGIHARRPTLHRRSSCLRKEPVTWMAGTGPAMTMVIATLDDVAGHRIDQLLLHPVAALR
jgi:hypothetical protein